MVIHLYSRNEIDEIKTAIEPFKIFYLESNIKPFYYLAISIIVYIISIYASYKSKYFVLFFSFVSVRFFMIFHDCCHNSFFQVTEEQHNLGFRGYNKIVAEILEPLVGFDEFKWRTCHAHHHKVHGNKSEYDSSRTVISIKEFNEFDLFKKVGYRLLRTPFIFFPLVSLWSFFVQHIFNIVHMLKRVVFYYIIFKFGKIDLVKKVFIGQLLGGTIGVMLFHLQHQVNTGYWESFDSKDELSHDRAQLHGASMLHIPKFLKWVTFGIEYHHIHHLTPRIPSYNLQKCHDDNEYLFKKITKVGYIQAFKSIFHTLYDENKKKYVSFGFDRFFGLQA